MDDKESDLALKKQEREIVYLVEESHKKHKTVLFLISKSSNNEMLQTLDCREKGCSVQETGLRLTMDLITWDQFQECLFIEN